MIRDARTTPPVLRVPALLFLGALLFLFASAFVETEDNLGGTWLKSRRDLYWFSSWSMFTTRDREQHEVTAEMEVDGAWLPVDLPAYFPARWESGLRFNREGFLKNRGAMSILGEALCGRLRAGTPPIEASRVRFSESTWRKTWGTTKQWKNRRELTVEERLDWTCGGRTPKMPYRQAL